MISINPDTQLHLCKTPLEANQQNQLTFANRTAQESYFSSLNKRSFTGLTYVRKDSSVAIELPYDQAIEYNYCYYKNTTFSNKFFYCFITGYEYINENTTKIFLKCDVYQTWLFELVYKKCFVEREHVANDTRGLHTLPEGLETGDMVINGNVTDFGEYPYESMMAIVGLSEIPDSIQVTPSVTASSTFHGMPSSIALVGQKINAGAGRDIIKAMDLAGKGDAVQFVFIAPEELFGYGNVHYTTATWSITVDGTTHTFNNILYPSSQVAQGRNGTAQPMGDYGYAKPSSLGGLDAYTPKNNKLFCFPFCSLNVSNNAGQTINYRWEDFIGSSASFSMYGAVCPGLSIKLEPRNYKNITNDNENGCDYGLTGAKYPICNWVSDIYTNWQTQNGLNLASVGEQFGLDLPNTQLSAGSMSAIKAASGVGLDAYEELAPGSGALNLLGNISSSIEQRYKASMIPDQAKGNINAGDVMYSLKHNGFTFIPISCKKEYAIIADQFFSMYGYKVNNVKIPEMTTRPNWNFVKTIGCNFEGDIPQIDLQEIRNIFDNGITLWHNINTFENYDVDNYAPTR